MCSNEGELQGESKKTGISKILNFVWGPLKCTKLNFNPMHIFSPLRDIWFNGITMDFSFKNEWVIAIWKFWDPSFFWLTLYVDMQTCNLPVVYLPPLLIFGVWCSVGVAVCWHYFWFLCCWLRTICYKSCTNVRARLSFCTGISCSQVCRSI